MTGYPSTLGRGHTAPQRPLEISKIHIKSLVCPTDMKFGTHVEQAETNPYAHFYFPNGSTAPPRNFKNSYKITGLSYKHEIWYTWGAGRDELRPISRWRGGVRGPVRRCLQL